jgi:hypothetical protein
MTAAASDRRHAREVELCIECQAIAHEIDGLIRQDHALVQRECSIHGLVIQRTAQLQKEQRELAGLLDGATS